MIEGADRTNADLARIGLDDSVEMNSKLTAPVSYNSSSSRFTNAPLLDLALSSKEGK